MSQETKPPPVSLLRRSLSRLAGGPGPLLVLLLAVALGLRLYGVQWDQGGLYHPDERQLLMTAAGLDLPSSLEQFLDPKASPLNPHFFAYGSLPMYALEAASGLLERVRDAAAGLDEKAVLGRVLSAIADTATVLLLYLLGRRLYNERIALLGAMLTAFMVVHIQLSHFFTVDVPLTALVLATLYFSVRLMQEGRLRDGLLAGLFLGLAVATKTAVVLLVLPIALAWVWTVAPSGQAGPRGWGWREWSRLLGGLAAMGGVAALAFAVGEPYGLLDFASFKTGVLEQAGMAQGTLDYPYTRQFMDTAPYWFHIQQLGVWGMGLPLALAAWGGFAFVLWRGVRERRRTDLLLLSWALVYFLLTAGLHVKFMRYMLPITPLLGLFAAVLLWELRRWRGPRLFRVGLGDMAIALVVGLTFLYALAYVNIYSQQHPATRMSRWVFDNVPGGAVVLQEHWDEPLRGLPEAGYRVPQLPLYEPDGSEKANEMAALLAEADYVAIFSQRLYVSIGRLPERYPMTRRYYEELFSGRLGFEPVRVEAAYPNLLGLSLVNDTTDFLGLEAPPAVTQAAATPWRLELGFAQESFVDYDHPKVILFQKKTPKSVGEYGELLLPALPKPTIGLLLTEEQRAAHRAGGTWSEIFQEGSLGNRFPIAAWYGAVQLLFLLCLPLGLLLFRPLADRGYLLIKALAFLLVAYVSWLLASTGSLPLSRGSVLLTLLLAAALSAVVLAFWGREVGRFLRERWRLVLWSEVLFLAAFLAFVWVRSANPDLWHPWRGGEKPMDFAYLNAVVRSSSFPPYDPWFAGGYINYYYFGMAAVAALIHLTGIVPEVAYNLAVPYLFALTLGGAVSLSYNLIELTRRSWGWTASPGRVAAAAVVGGLFVAVVGNVDGLIQWGQGMAGAVNFIRLAILPSAGMPHLGDLASAVGESGLGGLAGWAGQAAQGGGEVVGETWTAWRSGALFPSFDFWRSSRMIPGLHITEFPYFTFLFGDLHAHMVALPFTLVALGLALIVALRVSSWRPQAIPGLAATVLVLGLVLGVLWATNTWDYPTYLLVAVGAVGLALLLRGAPLWGVALGAGGTGIVLVLLSRLLLQPYHDSYQAFYTGFRESPAQTNPLNYLAIHGLFLYIIVTALVLELAPRLRSGLARSGGGLLRRPELLLGVLYVLVAGAVLAWKGLALVVILIPLLLAVLSLVLRGSGPLPHRLAWSMVALALVLGIAVEIVTVQGDIDRMNTVFKFYLQAWVLLAIASAYLLWYLGQRGLFRGLSASWGRRLWVSGLLLLLGAVAIYPLAATPRRVEDRFGPLPPTLDGMAYMRTATYSDERGVIALEWDAEAIEWLRQNVTGSPVIVEGVAPEYHWSARVSIYTGLPTVVGWNWHQRQQRGLFEGEVWRRYGEVTRLYSTSDPEEALEILRRYDVEYVYVGEMERLYYEAPGIAKFEGMAGRGLEVAHRNPEVTIYRLLRPQGFQEPQNPLPP